MESSVNKSLTIKEMPVSERPREKMLEIGVENLSNEELLAILLATGTKKKTALEVARDVLNKEDGLKGLAYLQYEDLIEIEGIGQAKATTILSAIELGKRLTYLESIPKICLNSPESIANLMMSQMRYESIEKFKILLLDIKNQLISKVDISTGGMSMTVVDTRVVFEAALRKKAVNIVLVHNHPSGNPYPSNEDKDLTERLVKAGKILAIDVIDHLIIGDNRYFSFRENLLI